MNFTFPADHSDKNKRKQKNRQILGSCLTDEKTVKYLDSSEGHQLVLVWQTPKESKSDNNDNGVKIWI